MEKIIKSEGVNPSERYLSKMAERTFLSLWSFPNVYRQPGTEMADLMVVHGNDIILFSDKDVSWSQEAKPLVAWARWYKKAVKAGCESVSGAAKWISEHPDRVFMDAANKLKIPFDLSSIKDPRFHLVSVSTGVGVAIKRRYGGISGTLILNPFIKGDEHINGANGHIPLAFQVGDVIPGKRFVHVFTRDSLEFVMSEFDTITDFISYLKWRSFGFRKKKFSLATGEEELLTGYINGLGDATWDTTKVFGKHAKGRLIAFETGLYKELTADPNYLLWKSACEDSRLWDSIIEEFSKHVISGEVPVVDGHDPSFGASEIVLRFMASENRERRIILSNAFKGMLELSVGDKYDRYVRKFPQLDPKDKHGYVFMVTTYVPDTHGDYTTYRNARAKVLGIYCLDILQQLPELEHVIGIVLDAHPAISGQIGTSEDVMLVGRPIFDEDLMDRLKEAREHLNITPIDVKEARKNIAAIALQRKKWKTRTNIRQRKHFRA